MRNVIWFVVPVFGLMTLLLSGCSDPTPPIGRDLPKTFAPNAPYFDNRVKQRFPIGSNEETLEKELREEQFVVSETSDPSSNYRHSAVYEGKDGACKESWIVRWTANEGKITATEGRFSQVCM
jgi:hypothetical protein